jgi:hypothetical protein
MKRRLCLSVCLALLTASPAFADKPAKSATLLCFVKGDFPLISDHEKGRHLALGAVVEGFTFLDKKPDSFLPLRTSLLSDRHKILGGFVFEKFSSDPTGAKFIAPAGPGKQFELVIYKDADGPKVANKFWAVVFGATEGVDEPWAKLRGNCWVHDKDERTIFQEFANSASPTVEDSANQAIADYSASEKPK